MKQFKGYMHGVNLGGWLSQCVHTKEHYDSFINEMDIRKIKSWGMDHIRVPVDYDLVEEADGTYKESGFAYLDEIIEWCGKHGLNMILDLHKTFGFSFDSGEHEVGFFDNEEYQERFYRLWEEFARRFGGFSDRLAFELLNEVTAKEYCERWNRISRTCIERIRKISRDVKILIGGYYNNSIEGLKGLEDPYDDNIVYNFHCYEPLIFTHQGAPWIDGMDTSFRMKVDSTYAEYVRYSSEQLKGFTVDLSSYEQDKPLGVEYFEDLMEEAVSIAESKNVALYCGEFGVIDRATPEDALKWYELICSCFEKHSIGRAAWSYKKMDFGLSDERMTPVIEKLLKLI